MSPQRTPLASVPSPQKPPTLSAWGLQAKEHLRQHRPKQYSQLKEQGSLDQFCQNLADEALNVLDAQEESGASPDMARESAMQKLLLPAENQPNQ